jgi:diguanylate cyclase (GGDEF)-like protein
VPYQSVHKSETHLHEPGSEPNREPESPGEETNSDLELMRMRLRLALIGVGIVPLAAASALLYAISPGLVPMQFLSVFPLLGIALLPIVMRLPEHILKVTENLERSSAEMRRMYEVARADSLRDALTGLGNHRAFQEELDRELEWHQRYKVPVALLLIDLDDLKLVNDSEGHAAGDEMLRELGRLIGLVARYSDRAFRIGGDEFAILMSHTDADGALEIARRLQARAGQPGPTGRGIPFSGGISACPQLATTRSQLYSQADAALYWCKRHGRASIDVFQPLRDRGASVEATGELSTSIARIVNEHLLRPVYQPIVDLESGRVVGFEGLIRPTPESGFADPSSMFVAAESVGRTVELDQACLQTVVAGARAMPADQLLALNISPRTAEAPHFSTDTLLVTLARYGIAPQRVVVELTEREKVEDLSRLQTNLSALQRAGLRLLSQFRFDIVKIDLTLVQEGAERASTRAVLRSLHDLAGRWGASVIAEGLETAGQLRTIRELGVTAGQGYLLARPIPMPAMTSVDVRAIEAGGSILDRSGHLPPIPVPAASVN